MVVSERAGAKKRSEGASNVRHLTSLLRALDVIDALAEAGEPLGVTELARAAGQSTTSTYNIVNTLEFRGLVVKETDPPRYRLGWRIYELGTQVAASSRLLEVARPHLRRLVELTNETVMLGVIDGDQVLYLDREESSHTIRMVADVGHRSPLHSNASGKVLLAHQSTQFQKEYLDGGLEVCTPSTIVDPEALRTHLNSVVVNGHATCWQEREPELCSVSVPIFDFTGDTVAALTIAGPASRIDENNYVHLLPSLRETAGAISRDLGGVDVGGVE